MQQALCATQVTALTVTVFGEVKGLPSATQWLLRCVPLEQTC